MVAHAIYIWRDWFWDSSVTDRIVVPFVFEPNSCKNTKSARESRARGKLSHLLNVPDRSVEMNTTLRQRSDQYKEIKPLIESKSRGLLYHLLSSSVPSA